MYILHKTSNAHKFILYVPHTYLKVGKYTVLILYVFYCYIMNGHHMSSLKLHRCIISVFTAQESSHGLLVVEFPTQSGEAEIKVSVWLAL